jgi:hypothetical protein
MIDAFPTGFDEVLCRANFETYWTTPVQLSPAADAVECLAMLTVAALRISRAWDCAIHITIHPDGDGHRTGHLALLEVEYRTAWVRLWPMPSHHDFLIPPEVGEWLDDRGWIANEDLVEENPEARIAELTCDDCGYQIPLPMLTLDAVAGDTWEFAARLVAAIREVTGISHDRWFLRADVWAADQGRLDLHEIHWAIDHRLWVLKIAAVLPASFTGEAVWPAGTRTAYQACEMGMHQFHFGPCTATPIVPPEVVDHDVDDRDDYSPLEWNPSSRRGDGSVSAQWDPDEWEQYCEEFLGVVNAGDDPDGSHRMGSGGQ